jgi:hypothetical protein
MSAKSPALRVTTRKQLENIAAVLGVRPDWHEPDEQQVTIQVHGTDFDNAGFWGHDPRGELATYGEGRQELWIELSRDGKPVAEVNLATLLAWATGLED